MEIGALPAPAVTDRVLCIFYLSGPMRGNDAWGTAVVEAAGGMTVQGARGLWVNPRSGVMEEEDVDRVEVVAPVSEVVSIVESFRVLWRQSGETSALCVVDGTPVQFGGGM